MQSNHARLAGFPHDIEKLAARLAGCRRVWVMTGAGISSASGFPTYRDHQGNWQHRKPIQHQEFVNQLHTRQRYWARSMAGWTQVHSSIPNAAHIALAKMQESGRVEQLVTQNVDGLHRLAGSENVLELHGRLDRVICLDCGTFSWRSDYQDELAKRNPGHLEPGLESLPDGDARTRTEQFDDFIIPSCSLCDGTIMPDIVFFGGRVPVDRVNLAYSALKRSDCVLVAGSSLSVYSGFRFVKWAHENKVPLYAVNMGTMRGEEWFDIIVPAPCETALPALASVVSGNTFT